jgi:hypothetical protein
MRPRLLALFMLVGVVTNFAVRPKPPADPFKFEQIHFSVEDKLERPTALPEVVVDLLMNDEIVVRSESCMKKIVILGQTPSSLFMASEAHLDGTQQSDFVILGKGCLLGANIAPFWIVRRTSDGFRIILSWVSHDLDILPTKTHGYHDVRLTSATANTLSTVVCSFDGQKYAPTKRDLKPSP